MKRIGIFIAVFAAVLSITPAHADLIKQSATGYARTFLLTQAANPLLGATGAAPVVKIRKTGGAYVATTNTATEVDATNDPGRYQIVLTSTEVNTLGLLDYAITGTSANAESAHDQVVAFDPNDGARFGLSSLPSAAPGASGGLLTYGTGAGQINPVNGVLPGLTTALTGTATAGGASTITLASGSATTDLYKGDYLAITGGTGSGQARTITGYNGGTLVATVSRAWTTNPDATSVYAVIMNPHPALDSNLAVTASNFVAAPAVAVDGSGRVLLQPTQTGVTIPTVTGVTNPVSLPVTPPTGYGGGAGSDPFVNLVSTYTTAGTMGYFFTHTLSTYAGGDTSGVTTLLARVPGVIQPQTGDSFARLGAPAGASIAADIAAAPTATAIANAVWNANMDGAITSKAALVAMISNILGAGTNTYNSTTRVLTTSKKKQDGTTTAYTTTTTLNAGAPAPNPAGSTVTIGTLP